MEYILTKEQFEKIVKINEDNFSCDNVLGLKPFVQSDDSRCGPAVVKMILDYYGIEVTEDELCPKLQHTYELGCKNSDMENLFKEYGLKIFPKENGTIEELKHWVNQGVPVIVDWFTPGVERNDLFMPNGHASIIVGVDDKNVKLLDPEHGGVRLIPHVEFMRVWFDWENTEELSSDSKLVLRYMLPVKK